MSTYLTSVEADIEKHKSSLNTQGHVSNEAVLAKIREFEQKRYAELTHWDVCQIARHPARPHASDIIQNICDEFSALSGDRMHSDDLSIVGGPAKIGEHRCMILGQDKGRCLETKQARQFGMTSPHGFRKALRLAKMAERFNLPLITLIDTPGALPTVEAELANQSEAIATNIFEFCQLKTPIISLVIGEGMSGGALAIGVCDHMAMMENAIFSVISPEGCASILWKDAKYAADAAKAMQITAKELLCHKLIDHIIPEPQKGAHTNHSKTLENIKNHLISQIEICTNRTIEKQLEMRKTRYACMGNI